MSGRDSSQRKRGSSDTGAWDSKEPRVRKNVPEVKDDAAKKPKITMGFAKKADALSSLSQTEKKGIQMKLGGQQNSSSSSSKPKSSLVAAAFNDDSDSEPEEMPPEARMRMRNIGRETPTSAGPNSFGKTKQGFCDVKKVFEKTLKRAQDSASTTS